MPMIKSDDDDDEYIEIIPNAVRVISVLKTNEGDLSQIIPEYVQVITG